jgi:hypothetical protein
MLMVATPCSSMRTITGVWQSATEQCSRGEEGILRGHDGGRAQREDRRALADRNEPALARGDNEQNRGHDGTSPTPSPAARASIEAPTNGIVCPILQIGTSAEVSARQAFGRLDAATKRSAPVRLREVIQTRTLFVAAILAVLAFGLEALFFAGTFRPLDSSRSMSGAPG